MTRANTKAALAILLLLSAIVGCSTQKDVYSSGLIDLPEGARLDSGPGYASYADKDMSVEASYLSPRDVDTYFSMFRGGKYENPFPPASFMVFSLTIENRSEGSVTFNPGMTMLVSEDSAPVSHEDFTLFYTDLSTAGADDVDRRMEAYRESSFDTIMTIGAKERLQMLIIFRRPEEASGKGVLLLNGLYVDGKSRSVALQYAEDTGM